MCNRLCSGRIIPFVHKKALKIVNKNRGENHDRLLADVKYVNTHHVTPSGSLDNLERLMGQMSGYVFCKRESANENLCILINRDGTVRCFDAAFVRMRYFCFSWSFQFRFVTSNRELLSLAKEFLDFSIMMFHRLAANHQGRDGS